METHPDIDHLVRRQHDYFKSAATQGYGFRIAQLQRLRQGLKRFEQRFSRALKQDLGKSEAEAYITETGLVLHELGDTLKQLKRWMKPKRVVTPFYLQPAASRILYTPLGVNLIISPFNYPIALTFMPLIAALAAGNTAVLKTSELTPACSKAIQTLIQESFDPAYVAYVPGAVPETSQLLKQRFDHIFFTGSPHVGRIVMEAAAQHLTPVTLELGGKSPCIVHSDAKLQIAARRIVYGKMINAGQTCIAPDYVLVHQPVKEQLLGLLKARILDLYGENGASFPDYGRIVNEDHFRRLAALMDPEKIVVGGRVDPALRYIAPTVMRDVTLKDKVMSEEIFGPILPVLEYDQLDDALDTIAQLPRHPLAGYIFSESKAVQQALLSKIQFGGGCINHSIQHFVNPHLPFGGVGNSGIGSYHGFHGFARFSHKKSVLKAASWLDLPLIYPPYGKKIKLLRKILK
ncbi:MAG: aldehyde dehydrogenase [Desulfobacterales bacterium]